MEKRHQIHIPNSEQYSLAWNMYTAGNGPCSKRLHPSTALLLFVPKPARGRRHCCYELVCLVFYDPQSAISKMVPNTLNKAAPHERYALSMGSSGSEERPRSMPPACMDAVHIMLAGQTFGRLRLNHGMEPAINNTLLVTLRSWSIPWAVSWGKQVKGYVINNLLFINYKYNI